MLTPVFARRAGPVLTALSHVCARQPEASMSVCAGKHAPPKTINTTVSDCYVQKRLFGFEEKLCKNFTAAKTGVHCNYRCGIFPLHTRCDCHDVHLLCVNNHDTRSYSLASWAMMIVWKKLKGFDECQVWGNFLLLLLLFGFTLQIVADATV